MKQLLFIFFIFISLLQSCNYPSENESIASVKVDSLHYSPEENKLKSDIKLFPDSLLLKENLIQYYRDNSNDSVALATTNDLIQKDSSNARLWHIKAVLLLEMEDTINAIPCFEKAIDILPSSSDIIYLGMVFAHQKNNRAITLANNLIELFNDQYLKESLFIKGLYFSNTNNKTTAINYFEQCISTSYTFMEAYREKALAYFELKKYNEAIAVLTKATTIKNKYDEGYYYLGKCYEKIKNWEMARDSYQRALLYNPENEEAAEALELLQRSKE